MRLTPEVIEVLDAAKVEDNVLYLAGCPFHKPETPRLEPDLYRAVNAALVALGGKWNRKASAHQFEDDPADAIADAIIAGSIEDRKKALQFFETPDAVAQRLVEMADVRQGHLVLEPSAGRGAIVRAINARHPRVGVVALDIDPKHEPHWDALGLCGQKIADFLGEDLAELYDRVIANPPFSRQQDIDHVLHMHHCIRPGGLLVSVMSANAMGRQNRKSTEFRQFVYENSGSLEALPDRSFRSSGTDVPTCVVKIPKAA